MRKVDLTEYMANIKQPDGSVVEKPFNVRGSAIEILFNPELQNTGRENRLREKLAQKIEDAEDFILLEDDEWRKLNHAAESIKGLPRHMNKFLDRICDAETVEVEEKKDEDKSPKGKKIDKSK